MQLVSYKCQGMLITQYTDKNPSTVTIYKQQHTHTHTHTLTHAHTQLLFYSYLPGFSGLTERLCSLLGNH